MENPKLSQTRFTGQRTFPELRLKRLHDNILFSLGRGHCSLAVVVQNHDRQVRIEINDVGRVRQCDVRLGRHRPGQQPRRKRARANHRRRIDCQGRAVTRAIGARYIRAKRVIDRPTRHRRAERQRKRLPLHERPALP